VAVRICPHCKAEVTAANVAAYSNSIECPQCKTRLEVAPGARTISSFLGLVAAAIAWRLASDSNSDLSGVLPTLYAFLAFGIVSPLVLMFTANLRDAPAVPVAGPVHDTGSHDAGGQGGGHH
jgi:hypothetical protein